jgi:hypothetical protein
MCFGIGKRERAAPRAAEDQPALDPEVLAQRLDVVDQVRCRVAREVGRGFAGVRRASSTVALIGPSG